MQDPGPVLMQRSLRAVLSSAILLLAAPVLAAPAGFADCSRAQTADEKAICAEPTLIQDDARMVTLFKVATSFVGMGTRGEIEDAQVKWLESRHACKDDAACLREAYAKRIGQLQKVIDAVAARGPF